ncbi:hypothetical protein ELZ29_07260 [Enterococcus faecalis]|uniref:hypothetical protein n=1 Tax=Enterococcus faecalis TaxID=1351 RepID=UPI0010C19559|nr:hypothetical protein [Enterococcus faecalis]EGO2670929.1 hypothetical protein [Enterococcus faecalis]EGO6772397.1 hypothetical protein [Enterococcus faecalis]EGO8516633.1 hypothetical protein [Enterococcus faecalis]EGO9486592.1 hypothetical protein [Enterococcus faecalis]EHK0894432.1 hypothetical protein [Enterococcus faecalis]
MRVEVDSMQRIVLIDNHSPYGSLIFEKDTTNNHVTVYQDSEDEEVRTVFESLDESAYFKQVELIEGLEKVLSLLKEEEQNE